MIIDDLFKVHIAKSHGLNRYNDGGTAFVTNGFTNNGVQGYVSPKKGDKVFNFHGICISAFCEATVQRPPFMGRGNGGSGIIVLEPVNSMNIKDLYYLSSYINNSVRWRFSYGRMVSKDRIARIEIPKLSKNQVVFDISVYLPKGINLKLLTIQNLIYKKFTINSLFNLHSGDYHNASALPDGETPLVSCGDKNNGVMRFVSVPKEKIYKNCLTIAYNGQPMTSKFHHYEFAAKDDVAVCTPKLELQITTLVFIQYILNVESWRFSYGRKCFREKLSKTIINLPVNNTGSIDEEIIEKIVTNTTYWNFLEHHYSNGISLRTDILQ